MSSRKLLISKRGIFALEDLQKISLLKISVKELLSSRVPP